jgi:hypothetical protein
LCARSTRPFAWAGVGADDVDVERVECAAELGHAVAADGALMVDAENAVLVAVESDRLAPSLQIGPGRVKIGKGRLALDELKVHQPAGRIVDEDQQRALRPAILEPPMLAAVDLYQLADAFAPIAGLVNALQALFAIEPQPVRDHPLAHRLAAENCLVQFAQLLRRQGRAKIPIALANDRQRLGPQLLWLAPIAGTTASLRDQACRTLGPVSLQKPKYLTPLKPQQSCRRRDRQAPLIQIP